MRKFFLIFGTCFLSVIMIGMIVIFGFEKPIPAKWVKAQTDEVINYKQNAFESVDDIPNGTYTHYTETLSYTKEGNKTIVTITNKQQTSIVKSGSLANKTLQITISTDYYTDNGNTKTTTVTKIFYNKTTQTYNQVVNDEEPTELSNPNSFILTYMLLTENIYQYSLTNEPTTLKADLKDMMENNLTKVTQKSIYLKFHLKKDTTSAQLTYSLAKKKIKSFNKVESTYDGGVLTSRTTTTVTM